jgi:hypothetical protein
MWRINDTPDGNAFTHAHRVPAHLLPSIQDEDLRARIHGAPLAPDYAGVRARYDEYQRAIAALTAAEDELDVAIYNQWSAGADLWPIARALRISRQQVRRRSHRGAELAVQREHLTDE